MSNRCNPACMTSLWIMAHSATRYDFTVNNGPLSHQVWLHCGSWPTQPPGMTSLWIMADSATRYDFTVDHGRLSHQVWVDHGCFSHRAMQWHVAWSDNEQWLLRLIKPSKRQQLSSIRELFLHWWGVHFLIAARIYFQFRHSKFS